MIGQVSSLYSQLYQLAYSTAKLAEAPISASSTCLSRATSPSVTGTACARGCWPGSGCNSRIRQLERAYIDQNEREFEITRYVSLLLHDPGALIALKMTGECVVELPEALFDLDYPGHYLRRLRDVSLTIPCVAGPYTSINCTLTLLSSKIRFDPAYRRCSAGRRGGVARGPPTNTENSQAARTRGSFTTSAATQSIATSHAQNDSGIFEVNFRDERYLPFETAGAISRWKISMPSATNAFDPSTVTDVVLKLSYTARDGGELLRTQALQAATLPPAPQQTAAAALATPNQTDRTRLFSLKHEFPSEWHAMLHPADLSGQYGQMPLQLRQDRFPYQYRGDQIHTGEIELFAILSPTGSSTPTARINAYLTPQAPPTTANPPTPPQVDTATDLAALMPQPVMFGQGAPVLYGLLKEQQTTAVPYNWWLSIPALNLAAITQQVSDIYAVFHYSVAG